VVDWLVQVMRAIGGPGVAVATAVESVFPPVPSEVVLPLAGYTASLGHYGFVSAVLWATAGSVVGALVLYHAAAAWGEERLCGAADRLPLVRPRDVRRAVSWFARHGRTAVFLGRLVPGVRSLISVPAGIERMPILQFTVYTAAGSLLWNGLLVGAGFQLGSRWHVVERYVGGASTVVYVLLGVAAAVFLVRRWRS
jgi:membrane protein DedA with SNARE-associated domain